MEYIILASIFILAGIVPELTGFGVATVSMALLPFVLPLPVAIPLVAIISMITTGIVSFQVKTRGLWKYILPIVGGSAIGVPLGMLFLNWINTNLLQTILAVFLMAYALYGLLIKHAFLPSNHYRSGIVGLVAGFFSASFNIHGPLVGAYVSRNKRLNGDGTKDVIATYMFISGIFTVAGHTIAGRVTEDVLFPLLLAVPALCVGLFIGSKIFEKLHIEIVRKIIYIFIFFAGLALFL